jgi:predicted enzyme related to lactoylglutathione lyase
MKNFIGIIVIILLTCSTVYAANQSENIKVEKMNRHEKINYVEFPSKDLEITKTFFSAAFGWSFVDYGPEYVAFTNEGLDGGFFKSDLKSSSDNGSALIVLYSNELETTLAKIEKAGGAIIKPIFSFPGGRRFHFIDPNGNEYAVWSE